MLETSASDIKFVCGLICADADSLANAATEGDICDFSINRTKVLLACETLVSHTELLLRLI